MNTPHNYEFHLMQLADSFFPSGMFGSSSGLESAVRSGVIKSSRDVASFLKRQITFQLAPCDCKIMIHVMNAAKAADPSEAASADLRYFAMKQTAESRLASVRSGRQLLECAVYAASNVAFAKKFRRLMEAGKTPGTYPACLAIASHSFDLPAEAALRLLPYSYSVSVIGAAIRMGIIQHFDAQKILSSLQPRIEQIAELVKLDGGLDFIWQFTPLSDILQMQHEHDEYRMFAT